MRPLHLIPPGTNFNFMRLRLMSFGFSAFITIASLVMFFVPGLNYGIDFRGGILIEVRNQGGPADLAQMRTTLGQLGLGEVALQEFGSTADVLIRIERQEGGDREQNAAVEKVRTALGGALDYRRVEVVGPKVGGELIEAGIWATVLSVLGIAVYVWFRFEWQFAVSALIATFHDVITTVGLFALFQIDFNLSTVAAVLTIAGYSINDTVVVFDRIRETMRKYKKMSYLELMNRAINDTLSRTLLTSSTVMLAVLALVLVGGEVIRSFSVAMIWGVLIGTYSSIFLASPMLLYMRPPRPTEAAVPAEAAKTP